MKSTLENVFDFPISWVFSCLFQETIPLIKVSKKGAVAFREMHVLELTLKYIRT